MEIVFVADSPANIPMCSNQTKKNHRSGYHVSKAILCPENETAEFGMQP